MTLIRIPTPLRPYTEGLREIDVDGKTVGIIIQEVASKYPSIQPHLFDNEGNLRDRTEAESNIKFALDLIMTLENNKINKTLKKITNLLTDLLAYFDRAATIVNDLKHIAISEDVLKDFCLAWQYQKHKIKVKHKQRRNFYMNQEKEKLARIQQALREEYPAIVDIVYSKLDGIVRQLAD